MLGPTAFILTHRSSENPNRYSASLQALAMMRSLGRRGVPVVRFHPGTRELSLKSRYCTRAEVCPNVHDSEPALAEFLLERAGKYPGPRVLLPASDDTAYFLGRHREALSAAYRVVAPSAESIETIIDKQRQYAVARRAGIPIPETHFPGDAAEVEALAERLTHYPYVIKPNVAHRWRLASVKERMRTPGAKAIMARNAGELLERYRAVAHVDPDIMVQRVVPGPDEELYGFFGYFDQRSRPLGVCVRRKLRQMPLGFGYCTLIESCEEPAVVRQSVRLLRKLRFHGIVGVEWKRDPDSGQLLLLEVNARATNTSALPPVCGVDLPWIAFADAAGQHVSPVTSWKSGVRWIWLSQDVWAARALGLGFVEWLSSLQSTMACAVFASDDLRPFAADAARFLGRGLARGLKRAARLSGALDLVNRRAQAR